MVAAEALARLFPERLLAVLGRSARASVERPPLRYTPSPGAGRGGACRSALNGVERSWNSGPERAGALRNGRLERRVGTAGPPRLERSTRPERWLAGTVRTAGRQGAGTPREAHGVGPERAAVCRRRAGTVARRQVPERPGPGGASRVHPSTSAPGVRGASAAPPLRRVPALALRQPLRRGSSGGSGDAGGAVRAALVTVCASKPRSQSP